MVVALLFLGGWLTTQSAWWWLLQALFIVVGLLFLALAVTVHIILKIVAPGLTKRQKKAVGSFVSKLERVAEHLQTPQFVIIYYVVRETISPRRDGFIESVSRDSTSLAPDFTALRREFE